jgi:hypothetical protein
MNEGTTLGWCVSEEFIDETAVKCIEKGMRPVRDYRTSKDLGIRLKGDEVCRVIRQIKGEWIEIGRDYELPVDPNVLIWSPPGIPSSVLAVALRIYELDNPASDLRIRLMTKRVPIATRWKLRYTRPANPRTSVDSV